MNVDCLKFKCHLSWEGVKTAGPDNLPQSWTKLWNVWYCASVLCVHITSWVADCQNLASWRDRPSVNVKWVALLRMLYQVPVLFFNSETGSPAQIFPFVGFFSLSMTLPQTRILSIRANIQNICKKNNSPRNSFYIGSKELYCLFNVLFSTKWHIFHSFIFFCFIIHFL